MERMQVLETERTSPYSFVTRHQAIYGHLPSRGDQDSHPAPAEAGHICSSIQPCPAGEA